MSKAGRRKYLNEETHQMLSLRQIGLRFGFRLSFSRSPKFYLLTAQPPPSDMYPPINNVVCCVTAMIQGVHADTHSETRTNPCHPFPSVTNKPLSYPSEVMMIPCTKASPRPGCRHEVAWGFSRRSCDLFLLGLDPFHTYIVHDAIGAVDRGWQHISSSPFLC